jgi:hypothetical protein
VASYVASQPLQAAGATCARHLTVQPAPQVVGQFLRRGITAGRIFVEAFQTNRLHIARHGRHELTRWRRLVVGHLRHGGVDRVRAKRRLSCQGRVQHSAETVDIARGADRRCGTAHLFRGHVGRRTEDLTGDCQLSSRIEDLGQTEIGDVWLAIGVKQHVCRLQIAMQDTMRVGVLHCAGDLLQTFGGLARQQGTLAQYARQRRPIDKLHRVVRDAIALARLENLHDIGMVQTRGGLGLDAKARRNFRPGVHHGRQYLQSNHALEACLRRLVDNTHPATTDDL